MRIVPFFIPHIGCPCKCSFCNQHSISGSVSAPSPKAVETELNNAVNLLGNKCEGGEIAFYGGSFTAINKEYRDDLLRVATNFVNQFGFRGIRFSTRPDMISDEILTELEEYPISRIELGAQSMDNTVLQANKRGHTRESTITAAKLLRVKGIPFTLQMMTGLYKDTAEKSKETARELALLKPDEVRIYPTLVIADTELETLYNKGEYTPQTLDEAIELSSWLLDFFQQENNIRVIRLGLHNEDGLADNIIAGPYHPAFRELCEGYSLYSNILDEMVSQKTKKADVLIANRDISKLTGHGGYYINKLKDLGYMIKVKGADLPRNQIIIQ